MAPILAISNYTLTVPPRPGQTGRKLAVSAGEPAVETNSGDGAQEPKSPLTDRLYRTPAKQLPQKKANPGIQAEPGVSVATPQKSLYLRTELQSDTLPHEVLGTHRQGGAGIEPLEAPGRVALYPRAGFRVTIPCGPQGKGSSARLRRHRKYRTDPGSPLLSYRIIY